MAWIGVRPGAAETGAQDVSSGSLVPTLKPGDGDAAGETVWVKGRARPGARGGGSAVMPVGSIFLVDLWRHRLRSMPVSQPLQTASSMAWSGRRPALPRPLRRNSAVTTFFPCRCRHRHSSRSQESSSFAVRPPAARGCASGRLRPADRHRGRNGAGSKTENGDL